MASYSELRTLTSHGVRGKQLPVALAYLSDVGLQAGDPNRESDDQLLTASIESDAPAPLLCLRCHISHPLEAWMRVLYGRFKDNYDLDSPSPATGSTIWVINSALLEMSPALQLFSPGELPSGVVSP